MTIEFKQYGIGQPSPRLEDVRFVTGTGCYIDDAGTDAARAYIVRSPYAHTLIRGIDTDAARQSPGVMAVLTWEDWRADGLGPIPDSDAGAEYRWLGPLLSGPEWPRDRASAVRGDAVAMVVAGTLEEARDAAELVGDRL